MLCTIGAPHACDVTAHAQVLVGPGVEACCSWQGAKRWQGEVAGLENHNFLIKEKDSNEIRKVSKRRVKTMERKFCRSLRSAAQSQGLGIIEPHAVPSVLSAREKEEKEQWVIEAKDCACC